MGRLRKRRGVVVASRCAWTLYNFRLNLVARVRDSGVPVVALGAELDGFGPKLLAAGFDYRPLPVPLKGIAPLGDAVLFVKLALALAKLRPRVYHAYTIKPVIYGTLAAALVGVPRRVVTIPGLGHSFTEAGGLVKGVVAALYRMALRHAHVVFFQNAEDRALFVDRGLVDFRKTALVAGSGVDLARFSKTALRPGLPTRPVRFAMITRLLRDKGVMIFVEAAERLTRAGLTAEFVLIGGRDGRNPTSLTDEVMERIAASPVTWVGPRDDVTPELEAADVIVLPTYYREGTPKALLEAMATGRPIITTDTPGCRQLVQDGHNGVLVPVKDVAALTAAMRRMIEASDTLERMGEAAREFVALAYDEVAVIDETLAAYDLPELEFARAPAATTSH